MLAAFSPAVVTHAAARALSPCTVTAFVTDAAPVPLGPPKGPVWVVPEIVNIPYIAESPNTALVPPTVLPDATVIVVVALVSFTGEATFHLIVIVPVAVDGPSRPVQAFV